MNSQDFIKIENEFGAHNYHPIDVVIEKAEGVWVWDVEGKKYLDFLSAYSAVNQGHRHPKIYDALVKQAGKVSLTSRAFRNDVLPLLYKKLNQMTGYEKFLPMNTGAEAVETAIKTARKWGYKVKGLKENTAEIIVATDNFHGRTTTVISFSNDPDAYKNYGPYTPGFKLAKYGDIEDFKANITNNTAAIMIEPIQGEAGIIPPPAGFLKQIAELCKENNCLFICDEIQSGLGRSGKLFAHYYEDVRPDVVIVGKALGGGYYPVSGVLADSAILDVFEPGSHGSTFGGNPLAAAVAIASLEVIEEEKLPEKSFEQGKYFVEKLNEIKSPLFKEVRGAGLWIGLELTCTARPFTEGLKNEGLLCKETHVHTIRFAPPLIITKEEIDWAIEKIKRVFDTVKPID
ncbi:MAG: ornithine--oxo-acid transaminase [Ignavibacteria bacterium GWF2_33_9]|nr:MAG: ornithine--oxo-acid transaminase [Ignavibacteria bacterium GWF2_33_9]